MDSIERQRKHFENISEIYFKARQTTNHLLLKDLMWSYFLQDKTSCFKDGLKVLEPMCGYAEGKKILEKHLNIQLDYEGFDYSEVLVKKVKEIDPSINISHQDVTKFQTDKKYDLIILIGGLHHVPQYCQSVVKNLYEHLIPGGYFISMEPTQNNFLFRKIREFIYQKNPLFDAKTERAFNFAEYNQSFLSNGFTIIDQIYPGLLSYVLYYNPDALPLLNVGNTRLVRSIFNLDKKFFRNILGKKLSFLSISIFQKPNLEN